MLKVVLRKMLNNKWMVLSLLIGNILLIAMVSSIPIYSNAILQRMLIKDLEQYQVDNDKYAAGISFKYDPTYVKEEYRKSEYLRLDSFIQKEVLPKFMLDLAVNKKTVYYENIKAKPEIAREDKPVDRSFRLAAMTGMTEHITLVKGKVFSNEYNDGVVEVIVSEKLMESMDILLNETLVVNSFKANNNESFKVKIVGIFKNSDSSLYWDKNPSEFTKEFFMDQTLFDTLFVNTDNPKGLNSTWFSAVDYSSIKVKDIQRLLTVCDAFESYFKKNSTAQMHIEFFELLKLYSKRALKLNTTLWVLQVPIFIVLAFFVFMVSKLIVDNEKNEIAVMKSRGASRFQVFMLFLIQSVIILGFSLLVAPFIGLWICKILGASNGFMELVQRAALELELSSKAYIYSFVAAALSIVTMVVPVINYSAMTIVKHKQSKSRKTVKPFWQKFFIDFVCLGLSLYGLYSYNNQKEYLAANVADGVGLDPLLFLSSTLFIIGSGLVFLRLLPYVIKLIFIMGKRFFSPSLYASFIKVGRSSGDEQFIMIFLILTLALGIFDAKAARTLNLNMEQKVNYEIGTDIVLKQVWEEIQAIESTDVGEETTETTTSEGYIEPDYTKFNQIKGVSQVTKVLRYEDAVASMGINNASKTATVLGVITDEFGKAAWFRNDLEPIHWYNYLNKMAELSNGALVSRSFEKNYGVKIGDKITVRGPNKETAYLIVCDFIDYFPTFNPVTKVKDLDGQNIEIDADLVVANLSYLQSIWGVTPYEIWMKLDGDSSDIYKFIEDEKIELTKFDDSEIQIIKNKNDPILQGTNGVLTVGFIIILIVCMTGFLIYWILSIKARVLQFGIFRAMGMSMSSVLLMLVNEQILITGLSVVLGYFIGEISSKLFVPLIQLGYSSQDQVLPLKVIAQTNDYIRLFTVVGLMIAICMVVLGVIISKIKIAQALKLGED